MEALLRKGLDMAGEEPSRLVEEVEGGASMGCLPAPAPPDPDPDPAPVEDTFVSLFGTEIPSARFVRSLMIQLLMMLLT